MTGKKIFSILITLFLPTLAAAATPTITCHCFTDRTYNAAHPAKTDPYFLATTQNSFFAAVFGIDKKIVVIKKQTGTSADDLWIAYWVGVQTNISAEELLQQKLTLSSWREVIAANGGAVKKLTENFRRELRSGVSDEFLARIVVEDILFQRHLLSKEEMVRVRREWIGNQELILSVLIASKTDKSATQLYREIKKGKSWGALLLDAKIDPRNLQNAVATLLGKK